MFREERAMSLVHKTVFHYWLVYLKSIIQLKTVICFLFSDRDRTCLHIFYRYPLKKWDYWSIILWDVGHLSCWKNRVSKVQGVLKIRCWNKFPHIAEKGYVTWMEQYLYLMRPIEFRFSSNCFSRSSASNSLQNWQQNWQLRQNWGKMERWYNKLPGVRNLIFIWSIVHTASSICFSEDASFLGSMSVCVCLWLNLLCFIFSTKFSGSWKGAFNLGKFWSLCI